jgi:cold shock CspA family protein
MARSQETYNKKEVRNRKEKKRKEKAQKRTDRRTSPKEGSSFDDMIAYVDENGRLTSERPDPTARKKIVKAEDIEISIPRQISDGTAKNIRTGIITFFNESKGYGFIRDLNNQQSVFVHINDMEDTLSENNKVSFEVEQGVRGLKAVHVKKAV